MLGYEPSVKAHLASEWQAVIFPEDLEVARANLEAHLANPDHPYDQIVRYQHKNGYFAGPGVRLYPGRRRD